MQIDVGKFSGKELAMLNGPSFGFDLKSIEKLCAILSEWLQKLTIFEVVRTKATGNLKRNRGRL